MVLEGLLYSKEHEWVKKEGDLHVIGITHFAQDQLGDIVYVELPEVGDTLTKGETFGTVESVKTVSDLFAPVSAEVVEVNPRLQEDDDDFAPELVNQSPYEGAWMVKVKLSQDSELEELMDSKAYEAMIAG